jgi:hypothetical protein
MSAGGRDRAVPYESDMRIHVYKLSNERPEEFGGSLSGCLLNSLSPFPGYDTGGETDSR